MRADPSATSMEALTLERLSTLPKLDKNEFINSYIQQAKSQSLSSSWHDSTPKKASTGSHNVGFATPILTARVPRSADEGPKKENLPSDLKASRKTEPKAKPKAKDNPEKPAKPQKSLPKKRRVDSDPDEEQAARLLERRDRKRIKRAIVEPKEASEPDTEASNGHRSKKRTKAKSKKTKVPSGFALMHGFTATNVGKNRLTLKPPSNVGVFKKGKASVNTKIKEKPKGHQSKHFSEFGFLNTTKKTPEQAASESSSTSNSDSSASSAEEIPEPKKKAAAQKARQAKSLPKSTLCSQQASELSNPQRHPVVESEIWDIESRASEKKKKLAKQKTRCADDASTSYVQRTIIVDASMPQWCGRVGKATKIDPVKVAQNIVEIDVPDAIVITSSPSLRPSQSASQIGQLLAKPRHAEEASHYFPAKQQTRPLEPDNISIEPTIPSLDRDPGPGEICQDIEPPNVHANPGDGISLPPVPVRFVVPTRNRVFAKQFFSAQGVRSQSEDFYASDGVISEIALGDCPDLEDYTGTTGAFPERPQTDLYLGENPARQDYFDDELLHSALHGHPQLDDYVSYQSSAGGDANIINPVWSGDDAYDDEEFDEQYEDEFGNPVYMNPVEDGDCVGDSWQVGVLSDSAVFYDHHEIDTFMGSQDDVEGPVPNGEFEAWEEPAANSVYFDDCWQDGVAWDDKDPFMVDDGQRSIESSSQVSGVLDDSEDIVSGCADEVGAYHARFAQGRALLLGLPVHESPDRVYAPPHFSNAEVDVAKALRGHWLPQRL